MAKKKADYIAEAKALGIKVEAKDTIEKLKQKIAAVSKPAKADSKQPKPRSAGLAKAGKRSAKGLKEAEEKLKKELRKKGEIKPEAPEVKKGPVPITRPRIDRRTVPEGRDSEVSTRNSESEN